MSTHKIKKYLCYICITFFFTSLGMTNSYANEQKNTLEEIIVTAQKREQKLQDTPISMSVLNESSLLQLGITSLDGLMDSIIPSLKISPNGNSTSSLTISIRGDGPSDTVQPLRENPVSIYLDGIYLGRAQGLNMEIADLKRIEVLRGPQGTLFGRNSTSGAVSLITNKPTGELGIKQTLGAGNYDAFRSATRINLPSIAGVNARISYLHSERNGWVENRASNQADFNELQKKGGDLSLNWNPSENVTIDYRYDKAEIEASQSYFQLYEGNVSAIPPEKNREDKTRFPLVLKPSLVELDGHSFIANWIVSDNLTVKSLSAYRELIEDGFTNYGGVLSSNGIVLEEDVEQEQFSQELQLIGSYKNIEWVTGLFYFKENADYNQHISFSLTPAPNPQPLIPPVSSPFAPPTFVSGSSKSAAVYSQGTIALCNKLDLTIGARYTTDKKSAVRNDILSPNLKSEKFDSTLSLSYEWADALLTYFKWSTAYKAGGYNTRSITFNPYDEETNQTFEIGMKSEWYNQRVRLNVAAFKSKFKDKQFDFADPVVTIAVDTLNAIEDVKISGLEIDLTSIPIDGIILGLQYTYLDGDMPEQPHPNFSGFSETFELIQTPQHSGSLAVDYTLPTNSMGTFTAHVDITSTSRYAHSTVPISSQDSYTLLNARLALNQFMQIKTGDISVSLWGRNLADEKYANLRYKISATNSTIQSFGLSRTFGIDFTYEY